MNQNFKQNEIKAILGESKILFEKIKPLLYPNVAADIQERLWEFSKLSQELDDFQDEQSSLSVPLASRIKRFPKPLNPFFFKRKK